MQKKAEVRDSFGAQHFYITKGADKNTYESGFARSKLEADFGSQDSG